MEDYKRVVKIELDLLGISISFELKVNSLFFNFFRKPYYLLTKKTTIKKIRQEMAMGRKIEAIKIARKNLI